MAAEPIARYTPAAMLRIVSGDLDDPRVIALLRHHVDTARAETGRGSAHALDVGGLRSPDIAFRTIWDGQALLGMGAIKRLSADHGEVKSMHIVQAARRHGAGSAILRHLIATARAAGLARLSLETGSWAYFAPARAFYRRHGFEPVLPFAEYEADPNSIFLSLDLRAD